MALPAAGAKQGLRDEESMACFAAAHCCRRPLSFTRLCIGCCEAGWVGHAHAHTHTRVEQLQALAGLLQHFDPHVCFRGATPALWARSRGLNSL